MHCPAIFDKIVGKTGQRAPFLNVLLRISVCVCPPIFVLKAPPQGPGDS